MSDQGAERGRHRDLFKFFGEQGPAFIGKGREIPVRLGLVDQVGGKSFSHVLVEMVRDRCE